MIVRLWRNLPVILRAIIVGELVVSIGGVPPELAIVANLRTSPHLPWLLVVTAIWLWFVRLASVALREPNALGRDA